MARSSDSEFQSEPVSFAPPVSDGNEEFPVPFARFAATIEHTENGVYLGLLRMKHAVENHKPSEWMQLLEGYKGQPAHPHHPDYDHAKHG